MRRCLIVAVGVMFTLNRINGGWPKFKRNSRSAVAVLAIEQPNPLSDTVS